MEASETARAQTTAWVMIEVEWCDRNAVGFDNEASSSDSGTPLSSTASNDVVV
jgi:hypothetical protein